MPVEILFHGEAGAEQGDAVHTRIESRAGGCLGDMDERDGDRFANLLREDVHGIGADHQPLSPAPLQSLGDAGEYPSAGCPIILMLEPLDLVEFHAVHQDLRRMQATEPLCNQLVDALVIMSGGFPADPADHTQCLHFFVLRSFSAARRLYTSGSWRSICRSGALGGVKPKAA